ncbi:MAG TPA: epimerase [Desulfobulbaceae bacterium]|nr:epimerase [Desulfobulbaceae bacterium]
MKQNFLEGSRGTDIRQKKLGVLIGGSGLVGGALIHYCKTRKPDAIELLSPNSKKISLREPGDIKQYFRQYRPDFIINCAITTLDSDAQLTYETNYLGCINLARAAMALKVPYIHFSSAATLPDGEELTEEQTLPLSANLSNYAKSKLMTEKTLRHLHETGGLDYTLIKLGVVYGTHDHKVQGFHRLLMTIARKSLLFMMTSRGTCHSYTCCNKIPPFVDYLLAHREEFSGQTYHFVDREPVELGRLILSIKSTLGISVPKEIYIPYPLARFGTNCLQWILRGLNRLGIEARLPPELMFMENCYATQTLSTAKLKGSSYGIPEPETTVFTELPAIIDYYVARWAHLNLVPAGNVCFVDPLKQAEGFAHNPQHLIEAIHSGRIDPLADFAELRETEPAPQG